MNTVILLLLLLLVALELWPRVMKKTPRVSAPCFLMRDGKIRRDALEQAQLSLDELMALARSRGYFNLGDIDMLLMEANGDVSILPKPRARALNTKDFNFNPVREGMPTVLCRDGALLGENLVRAGIKEKELLALLTSGDRQLSDILLATMTESGRVDIFEK